MPGKASQYRTWCFKYTIYKCK